ncbi:MAG: hypothetical protein Q7S51_10295 [Gallionellaceae bacterium]|nr:hypothetical protein [Gallionellaceae bacterium]
MTNWTLTEKPPIKRHHNVLNDHALSSMDKAKGCAKWLAAQGYTVLAIAVGRRNPRIEIQACRHCSALEGAVFMHERTASGVRRNWVALRFDCEVRWTETGSTV